MSPERAGHFEVDDGTVTPKMSVPGSPVAGTPVREAQSPISILLAVAAAQAHQQHHGAHTTVADDDLTNLNWLQNRDLLKGMNLVTSPTISAQSTPVKVMSPSAFAHGSPAGPFLLTHFALADQSPTSDYLDDSSVADGSCSSGSFIHSPIAPPLYPSQFVQSQLRASPPPSRAQQISPTVSPQRNRHPHNVPYDPLVHTANKPPYSFSCLIFMAIEDCQQKALPVKEIYAWIVDHFPYFNHAPTGWKNSVRHNLSLNKCFQKVEKASNLGKGSLWTVDQQYRPNLLQALTRSPYHPCSTLDPTVYLNKIRPDRNTLNNNSSRNSSNCSSPQTITHEQQFAYYHAPSSVKKELVSDDSLDAADAAAVMLSLRNPTRKLLRTGNSVVVVATTSPSQDHTYSAADTCNGSPDEAFESGDEERPPKRKITCRKIDFAVDDEETRRIKEGAETLLNLAGISTRKRDNSQSLDYVPFKRLKGEPPQRQLPPLTAAGDGAEPPRERHFRPRLLRRRKRPENNNTIVLGPLDEDMWAKHRREMQMQTTR